MARQSVNDKATFQEKIRETARLVFRQGPATQDAVARALGWASAGRPASAEHEKDITQALQTTDFQPFVEVGPGRERAVSPWEDVPTWEIQYRLRRDENGKAPPAWARYLTAERGPEKVRALEWECYQCGAHAPRFGEMVHRDRCIHGPLQVRTEQLPRIEELLAVYNRKASRIQTGGGLKFRRIRDFPVPTHNYVGKATLADPFGDQCKVKDCSPESNPKHWFDTSYTEIQLDGEVPKIPGWTVLGRVESTPAGNLVSEVPGQKIPARFRDAPSNCDHCGLKRNRTDTVILQKGNETKQIGRTCLRDFLGTTDAEEMVRMFLLFQAQWAAILEDKDDDGGDGIRLPRYNGMSLHDLLTFTAAAVRRFGFVSKAQEGGARQATVITVRGSYEAVKFGKKHDEDPRTPADAATAAAALEWIKANLTREAAATNFDSNIAVLVKLGWIPIGKEATAVQIFERWRKAMGLFDPKTEVTDEFRPEAIGEKVTIRATVTQHKERAAETDHGFSDLYKLRDEEGRTLTLFVASADQTRSGYMSDEITDDDRPGAGAKVIVTIKIKKKDLYRGNKETRVSKVGDWAIDVGQDLDAPAAERKAKAAEARRLHKEAMGDQEPETKLKRLAPLAALVTVRDVLLDAWRRAAYLPWQDTPKHKKGLKYSRDWAVMQAVERRNLRENEAWFAVLANLGRGLYTLDSDAVGAGDPALEYLRKDDAARDEAAHTLSLRAQSDPSNARTEIVLNARDMGFDVSRDAVDEAAANMWRHPDRARDPALIEAMEAFRDLVGEYAPGKTGKERVDRPQKPVKVKPAVVDGQQGRKASSRTVAKKNPSSSSSRTPSKKAKLVTVGDLLKQAYVRSRALPWVPMRELAPVVETLEQNAWAAVIRSLGRKYNLDSELEFQVYPEIEFLEADDATRDAYRHMDAGGRMADIIVAAAAAGFAVEKGMLQRAGRTIEDGELKDRLPVTGDAPDWAKRNMSLMHTLLGKSKRKARVETKEYKDAEGELAAIMRHLQADIYRLEPYRIEKVIHNLRGLRRKQIAYVLGEVRPDLQAEIHGFMTEEYAAGEQWRSEAEESLLRPKEYAARQGADEAEAQGHRLIALGHVVGGRTLSLEAVAAFWSYVRSRPERWLRLLLSTGSRDISIGTARRLLRELALVGLASADGAGRGMSADALLRVWTESYKQLAPAEFRQSPSELPARLDDAGAWQDWRKVTIDAFDRVRRQPMDTEEQMFALAPIGARRDILFALEARPGEIHSMDDVVRGWMQPQFRGPLPSAEPMLDQPLVMGAYFEPSTPEDADAKIIRYMREVRDDDDDDGTRRWIASMTKRLREHGSLREEEDGRLVVDPDRTTASRSAMINDIAYAHTAALRMAEATSAAGSGPLENAEQKTRRRVMVSADSIEELRKIDVERVLREIPTSAERDLVALTLSAMRADLVAEIAEVMQDLGGKAPSAKKIQAGMKARAVLEAAKGRKVIPKRPAARRVTERDARGRGARGREPVGAVRERLLARAEPRELDDKQARRRGAGERARAALAKGVKGKGRGVLPASRVAERDQKVGGKGKSRRVSAASLPALLTFSRPVTSQELTALNRTVHAGTLSLANYLAGYEALVTSKPELLARWNAKTKQELGPNAPSGVTKKELVEGLWKRWLSVFDILPVGEAHTYSMSQIRKSHDERVAEHVAAMTEKKIAAINAARVADNAARKAAADEEAAQMAEPRTLEDYRLLARRIGVSKMTEDQRRRMEELEAEASLDAAAARRGPRQVEVAASDLGWHVVPTWHFRQNVNTWTVRKETKGRDIPKDEFMRLAAAARALSGKWERFTKTEGDKKALAGFLFFNEASANKFRAALAGETVDNAAEVERRQARADANRAENLAELAERTRAEAEASLSQDRKTNTAKRAREAAGQEGRARGAIGFADSLEQISDAIANGTAKFLRGVAHKTHVETLDRILRRAQSDIALQVKQDMSSGTRVATDEQRVRYQDAYRDYPRSFPDLVVADVDGVKYPWPHFYANVLGSIVRDVEKKAGCKLLAGRIKKMIARHSKGQEEGRETFTIDTKSEIEMLQDLAKCAPKSRVVEDLEDYNRVQAMGLTTLAMLKTALREYLGCCKGVAPKEDPIKAQERALIGRKYPGYFPTPRTLADEVVELADVRDGMRVLEPSAGKGDLAAAVMRAAPEAELEVFELQHDLREVLREKGLRLIGRDFLAATEEEIGLYDRIVANPPFEDDADADHVQHMYSLLKPGGRLVSIMGEGVFGHQSKKAQAFRAWLEEHGGTSEKNEPGAFLSSDRPTGVASRIVVIDKPGEARGRAVRPAKARAKEKARAALEKGVQRRKVTPDVRVLDRDSRGRGGRRAAEQSTAAQRRSEAAQAERPARQDQEEQARTRAAGRDDYLERKEARIDRLEGGAARAAGESEARYRRAGEGLPDNGQPLLVGHHSEKRHRAAMERADQNMRASIEARKEAQELKGRAVAARDNKAISSDDPEALTRLKEKLEKLTEKRESFKAINKAIRARDPGAALTALGYKPATVAKLIEAKGIPDYELTNSGATVREVKRRIAELEGRAETAAPDPVERGDYLARWDSESNRVVVEVPRSGDRPERDRRSAILGNRGFKWAESLGHYQRLANDSAWYAAIAALAELAPNDAPVYSEAAVAEQAERAAKVASVAQARGPYSRRNTNREDGDYFAHLDYGRVSLYLPGGRGGRPPKLAAKIEKALRAAGFQIKYGQWRAPNTDAHWRIACALVDAFADGGGVAAVEAAARGEVAPIGSEGGASDEAIAAAWKGWREETVVDSEVKALSEMAERAEGASPEYARGDYKAVDYPPSSKRAGIAVYAKRLPEGDARKAREKAMKAADFYWVTSRKRWEPRPSKWKGSPHVAKWSAAVGLVWSLSGGKPAEDAKELEASSTRQRRQFADVERVSGPKAKNAKHGRLQTRLGRKADTMKRIMNPTNATIVMLLAQYDAGASLKLWKQLRSMLAPGAKVGTTMEDVWLATANQDDAKAYRHGEAVVPDSIALRRGIWESSVKENGRPVLDPDLTPARLRALATLRAKFEGLTTRESERERTKSTGMPWPEVSDDEKEQLIDLGQVIRMPAGGYRLTSEGRSSLAISGVRVAEKMSPALEKELRGEEAAYGRKVRAGMDREEGQWAAEQAAERDNSALLRRLANTKKMMSTREMVLGAFAKPTVVSEAIKDIAPYIDKFDKSEAMFSTRARYAETIKTTIAELVYEKKLELLSKRRYGGEVRESDMYQVPEKMTVTRKEAASAAAVLAKAREKMDDDRDAGSLSADELRDEARAAAARGARWGGEYTWPETKAPRGVVPDARVTLKGFDDWETPAGADAGTVLRINEARGWVDVETDDGRTDRWRLADVTPESTASKLRAKEKAREALAKPLRKMGGKRATGRAERKRVARRQERRISEQDLREDFDASNEQMGRFAADLAANKAPEWPPARPARGVVVGARVGLTDENEGIGPVNPAMRGVVRKLEPKLGRASIHADNGKPSFWPLSMIETEEAVEIRGAQAKQKMDEILNKSSSPGWGLKREPSQIRAALQVEPAVTPASITIAERAVKKAKTDKKAAERAVKAKPPTTPTAKKAAKVRIKKAAEKLTAAEKQLAERTKAAERKATEKRCALEVTEKSARKAAEKAEREALRITVRHAAVVAKLNDKRSTCKKGCKVSAKRLARVECKLRPTLKELARQLQLAQKRQQDELARHAEAAAALKKIGVEVTPLTAPLPRKARSVGPRMTAPAPGKSCGTVCHIEILDGLCGGQAAVLLPGTGSAGPREVPTRYCLVEATKLISSHDPMTFEPDGRYPAGVQERRYERDKGEQTKVFGIAQNPRPEIVINTSASPLDGTPVVTTQGFVLGGNGRSMGIRRNYLSGGTIFKEYLEKNAAEFGFTPAQIKRFAQPIIVRVIDPPRDEWSRYVRDLNQGLTQVMDAITESVSLARQMPQQALDALAEGLGDGSDLGEFFTSRASLAFVRSLEAGGIITTQNRNRMVRNDGMLTEDGRLLAVRQLSAAVLPDADLLEFAGPELRQALARSAPFWLSAAAHAGDWDLRKALEIAVRDLLKAHAEQDGGSGKKFSLKRFFQQVDLFNPPLTKGHPFGLRMLVMLDELAGKPAVFSRVAKIFANEAQMYSGGQGSLLAPKSALEVLDEAAMFVKINLQKEIAALEA